MVYAVSFAIVFRDCGPVLSSPLVRVVEAQIAMDRLPHSRSIYATPGRKSYGQRGVLPSEADPFAGLVQATWAFTEWGEHVTLPAFGFLTVKANAHPKLSLTDFAPPLRCGWEAAQLRVFFAEFAEFAAALQRGGLPEIQANSTGQNV